MKTRYMRCPRCGCLISVDVPDNLSGKPRQVGKCPKPNCQTSLKVIKKNQRHLLTAV